MVAAMNNLRIISRLGSSFEDRIEAGRAVARELLELRNSNPVILGIPRGGVVIASVIAEELACEFDIILSRKIGSPDNSELAIGAITENGKSYIDRKLADIVGASQAYIDGESIRVMAEIVRRSRQYRLVRPKVPLANRTVVIVDDGVATGATAMAAIWAVRQESPEKLIVAMPVGSPDTLVKLADNADEVICVEAPSPFHAIGQFYSNFSQTSDEEVIGLLKQGR